jgi:hypothetical protein
MKKMTTWEKREDFLVVSDDACNEFWRPSTFEVVEESFE